MSCCLCFAETLNMLECQEGSINKVIRKFMWINPTENDVICTICWSALKSFDSFYKSIEIAHNIQKDCIHEDELPFVDAQEPIEPKVSIEEIILQPKIEPPEHDSESFLVDPVDENRDIPSTINKRKAKSLLEIETSQSKKKDRPKAQQHKKLRLEKTDISPTRRSARHQKEGVKQEIEIELEDKNFTYPTGASIKEQSDEESDEIDDVYEPNEPSPKVDTDESGEEENKKGKTKRRSVPISIDGETKPKRKYKKLTPEEKEAKKNKSSSKQMKICAEWDQFLADFGFVFKCKICEYIGKDFRDLKGHFRVIHDKPRGYAMCCDRIFYKKEILVEHIQFHINPEHFKCNNCGMTFKASKSLEYHSIHTCKSINTEDVKKLFQCDECLKWFNSKFLLQRHKLSHMPLEERQWKCTAADCGKLFPTSYDLNAHIKIVHERAYRKLCDICGKIVHGGTHVMQIHLNEHQGIESPRFSCKICGAEVKTKYYLNRHMSSLHKKNEVKYVCKFCGKEAPNRHALRSHERYVHEIIKEYVCSLCPKKFKKSYELREHMATHTGENLYSCPHCPRSFKSNANMHSHRKKNHRKEWEENRRYAQHRKASIIQQN
ncbi:hypothetical protein ACFFRR_009557 [Megaselia abdita]